MSLATILYKTPEGHDAFAMLDRITHIAAAGVDKHAMIFLDTGAILETITDLHELRTRVEVVYKLRYLNTKAER